MTVWHNSPDEKCVNAQCPEHFPTPTDLQRIEAKLDAVLAISVRVEEMAQKVTDQIKPVLDDLMKSPLLKMLGVKSK